MTNTPQTSPLLRLVLLGAGLAIIAAGLNAAAATVNLILVSLLLATTLYPVPILLVQRGMKRGPAIALTAFLALLSGVALILVLGGSLTRLSDSLPKYQSALHQMVDGVSQKLAARGVRVDEALKPNPERIVGAVGVLVAGGLSMLGYGLFSIVLVVLFLVELPIIRPLGAAGSVMRDRLDEAMRLVRRYLGLNGLIGAVIALINFGIMVAIGTDAPALWAVITFLFAFVPFGFIISLIPPFLVTLLEYGIGRASILFGLFFVINFLGDNVIKPKIMGGGLGLSPLLIVLSLLIWGVVLGPMGALLAIPLTLTVKQILPVLMGEHATTPE